MRHIIPISGKDSLATAIVQKQLRPDLLYEYIFNDTEADLPDIPIWLHKVENALDIQILRLGKNLENVIYEQGILPSVMTRYCTRIVKSYELENYVGKDTATVYFGIRADEKRVGYKPTKGINILSEYPLQTEHMGINAVYELLQEYDLLPPNFFWYELFSRVVDLLAKLDKTWLIDKLPRYVFDYLFAGRSRSNCYFCFFQRQYEWIWLYLTHPDLFWHSVEIEENVGAVTYHWRADYSLRDLIKRANEIIDKRARKIVRLLLEFEANHSINDETEDLGGELLDFVSCGLFCGK